MNVTEFSNWYEELPILAYGELSDEEVLDAFTIILEWKQKGIFISDDIPDERFTSHEYWLFLGLLSNCIEYGSSPRGGWLTDFGKNILQFLKSDKHLDYLNKGCQ